MEQEPSVSEPSQGNSKSYTGSGTGRKKSLSRTEQRLVKSLGWLSVALGAFQLARPRTCARLIGIDERPAALTTLRAIGIREIVCGLGILSRRRPTGWMRARVAGDLMDLTLLGGEFVFPRDRTRLSIATAAVVGATALDMRAAKKLSRTSRTVVFRKALTINRPPEEVYRFWTEFENFPHFMTHLQSVRKLDEITSEWRTIGPMGKSISWQAEIVKDKPNEFIAWRSLPNSDLNTRGQVKFSPRRDGKITEILVELIYEPPMGRIGRAFATIFGKNTSRRFDQDLRNFKSIMETGEILYSDATFPKQNIILLDRPAQPPESTEPESEGSKKRSRRKTTGKRKQANESKLLVGQEKR